MKGWKKVLLAVLAILVLAVAGLCVWQWDNLKAGYTALTKDPEEIVADMETTKEDIRDVLGDASLLLPSTDQITGILDGTLDPEEVKEELGVKEDAGPVAPDTPEPQPQVSAQSIIDRCVAELSAKEVNLLGTLGGMKSNAIAQWNALPPEQRTEEKKGEIITAGISACYAMEYSVDAKVQGILDRYEAQLIAIGADTSVLGQLWNYYEQEKAAQKAYYFNLYLN